MTRVRSQWIPGGGSDSQQWPEMSGERVVATSLRFTSCQLSVYNSFPGLHSCVDIIIPTPPPHCLWWLCNTPRIQYNAAFCTLLSPTSLATKKKIPSTSFSHVSFRGPVASNPPTHKCKVLCSSCPKTRKNLDRGQTPTTLYTFGSFAFTILTSAVV